MVDLVEQGIYPPGPTQVPADLVVPSATYRRHAALAVAGLLLFIAAYLALGIWLTRTTLRLFAFGFSAQSLGILPLLLGVGSGLLTVFVWKALFFRKRDKASTHRELTAEDHPRLFAFLHRLADEARAPRPHRVFVSAEVNAGVFYDLTLLNLIIPSRKNLQIGLGLVNTLSLSEFKAVLAHEFGHFTQRTMAIGRWVYIAQQIAGGVVARRDSLDELLLSISSWDLRVAWIGWILRLIIWSIRSIADTMFRWVVLAERALGREMERHADLMAVSLAGSDAPIHALHRLAAADSAMDRALGFMESEGKAERAVLDVLAVQRRVIEHMQIILDDPLYGEVPPLPAMPASHRLFKARLAHPPRMWSTHPPNEERENLAKQRYLPAPLDDRSPWLLFEDPARLREQVTKEIYVEGKRPQVVPSIAESLRTLDLNLDKPTLDPRYRGVYLGRAVARHALTLEQLYDGAASADGPGDQDLRAQLDALYPEEVRQDLSRRRELLEELALLRALETGAFDAPGRLIRHRGQEHARRELPSLLATTRRELDDVERKLTAHDQRCRTSHLHAARAQGEAWEAMLRGLGELLHYATHRELDLDDAIGALQNAIAVVTADGRVSDAERERVLGVALDLHEILRQIHQQAPRVELGPGVTRRLECESWTAKLGGDLTLPPPSPEQLGDWLGAVRSWSDSASMELAVLRNATLDELLATEQQVAVATQRGEPLPAPPTPVPAVATRYRAFPPSAERPLQTRLGWWDRFAVADGYLPGAVRLAVAGTIVGSMMLLGNVTEERDSDPRPGWDPAATESSRHNTSSVTVYNGLDVRVVVDMNGREVVLDPGAHQSVFVVARPWIPVTTTVEWEEGRGELVDRFHPQVEIGHRYLYNVGAAAPLFQWSLQDGVPTGTATLIGAPQWHETTSIVRLDASLSTLHQGQGQDEVLAWPPLLDGSGMLEPSADLSPLRAAALAHARWDREDSPGLPGWLELAAKLAPEELADTLKMRRTGTDSVLLRRVVQDLEQRHDRGDGGAAACAAQLARASASDSADEHYLAARCSEGIEGSDASDASDERWLELAKRWPDHAWISMHAGIVFAKRHQWAEALPRLHQAWRALPGLHLEVPLARALRAAAPDTETDLTELLARSRLLRQLSAHPHHDGFPAATVDPFLQLEAGRIPQLLESSESQDAALLPLIAASDGAPGKLAPLALALPAESLTLPTGAALLGLALRHRRSPAPFGDLVLKLVGERDAAVLAPFLADLEKRKVPKDAALTRATLQTQGLAYSIATIALGARSPRRWRVLATRLLFARERPYFR